MKSKFILLASAATFAVGAGVPIVTIRVAPAPALVVAVSVVSRTMMESAQMGQPAPQQW